MLGRRDGGGDREVETLLEILMEMYISHLPLDRAEHMLDKHFLLNLNVHNAAIWLVFIQSKCHLVNVDTLHEGIPYSCWDTRGKICRQIGMICECIGSGYFGRFSRH